MGVIDMDHKIFDNRREVEEAALQSRRSNQKTQRRVLPNEAQLECLIRNHKKALAIKDQHGPVKQIVKDGKPCL
jgi:hypothetical protein